MDEPIPGKPYTWNDETKTWEPMAETPNRWIPSPKVREWIFGLLAAAGPIVAFYGYMTQEEIALWLGLGATILGTPGTALAARNVPRK